MEPVHFIDASELESVGIRGGAWSLEGLQSVTWLGYCEELGLGLSILSSPLYVILTQQFGDSNNSAGRGGDGGADACVCLRWRHRAEPASRAQLREWYPEKSLDMCTLL